MRNGLHLFEEIPPEALDRFSLRNFRGTRGREGPGCSTTLCFDGAPLLLVDDFGDGGALRFALPKRSGPPHASQAAGVAELVAKLQNYCDNVMAVTSTLVEHEAEAMLLCALVALKEAQDDARRASARGLGYWVLQQKDQPWAQSASLKMARSAPVPVQLAHVRQSAEAQGYRVICGFDEEARIIPETVSYAKQLNELRMLGRLDMDLHQMPTTRQLAELREDSTRSPAP